MDIVIASSTKPTNSEAFFQTIREACLENGVTCSAGVITGGAGCTNYGFRLEGDNVEQVANMLTLALMPARWAICEGDPMLRPGEFYTN